MPAAALPDQETIRLQVLHRLGVLDTPRERSFDELVEQAAAVAQAPIASITLVDEHRQWFKAKVGIGITETPRTESFCAHAILQRTPLIVSDAALDERFADNPLVTGPTGIRFYAAIPLFTSGGWALGTLCVADTRTRDISSAAIAVLERLARLATSRLTIQHAVRQIVVQVTSRVTPPRHATSRSPSRNQTFARPSSTAWHATSVSAACV